MKFGAILSDKVKLSSTIYISNLYMSFGVITILGLGK